MTISTTYSTEIWVTNVRSSVNGDNEIYIELEEPSIGLWKIELIGLSISDGSKYNTWYIILDSIAKAYENEPHPHSPTPTFGGREPDNIMTVYSPATADNVISVGAYASRLEWNYYDIESNGTSSVPMNYLTAPLNAKYTDFLLGNLAFFSSRGPRRDYVAKPDITGPGVGIVSSYSHFRRYVDWNTRFFPDGKSRLSSKKVLPDLESCVLEGTSQSAANIAGGIALLLEVNPSLNDENLRWIFNHSAIRDYSTLVFESTTSSEGEENLVDSEMMTGIMNDDWGYGKFDVASALALLV